MAKQPLVGIGYDGLGWHERYAQYADKHGLDYELFDMGRSDWLDKVKRCCCVLWRPNLDPPWLEQGREKIHFMERELGLRVFPNWSTFYHYDNKKAQAYFCENYQVPAPKTFVSYNRDECMEHIQHCDFPLVSKTSGGAGSQGVKLIRNKAEAEKEIARVFRRSLVTRGMGRLGLTPPGKLNQPKYYVCWQEFIEDNDRDYRLTVIGKKYAFVFYRRNRPNDFRASGSGMLEYEGQTHEPVIQYFTQLCRDHDFDVMAFDILFRGDQFYMVEMSYTHVLTALDKSPDYFIVDDQGQLTRHQGPVISQDLFLGYVADWVEQHARS